MKKILISILSAAAAMQLFAAETPAPAAEAKEVQCFVKERIMKEEVPWTKYYSPEFVNIAKDGTVKITVKRVPGGPVGAMVKYWIKMDQKVRGKITISCESRGKGFKGKDGYAYRMTSAFRHQGGGNTKEDHVYFPGTPDGNWHKVEKVYDIPHPVDILYLHVSLCYRNGEAEFRNFSVKVDQATLKPFTPPVKK